MRRALLTFAALCATTTAGPAAPRERRPLEYRLELDPSFEMESGVGNLTTLARLGLRGADWLVLRGEAEVSTTAGVLLRIGAGLVFDAPVAIEGIVLPHEVFGHGARARELGFGDSYVLEPPPPYAWLFGGELRSSTSWDFDGRIPPTFDETARFYLGGLETQTLQLRSLAFTAFRARTLSRGDALLYATASLEISTYVARTTGDVGLFYGHLHDRYGADESAERRRTQLAAALTVIDPLFAFSLYSYFYRYLVRGDRALRYPTLELGGTELSLTTGLTLVPWGREHHLTAYVGTPAGDFATTLGIGHGPGGSSISWSLASADLPLGAGLFLGTRLEVAYQPRLVIFDRDAPPGQAGSGYFGNPNPRAGTIAGDATLDYRSGRWAIGARLGTKTAGHSVGQPYAQAWTATVSLAARIGSD